MGISTPVLSYPLMSDTTGTGPTPDEPKLTTNLPPAGAPWYPDILAFAITFDGYEAFGDQLGDVAHANWARFRGDGRLPQSLTELRATLFFLHRFIRWNEDTGGGPSDDEMRFGHALIEAIRAQLVDGIDAGAP